MAENMTQTKSSKKRNKKKKNKSQQDSSNESQSSITHDEPDTTDTRPSLEQELEWCIQQIQIGLTSSKPKLTQSQRKEAESLSKKLSSSKTPLPRKRQLMHSNFGNYRQKMKEQPLTPSVQPSLTTSHTIDNGQFYRMSSKNNTVSEANNTAESSAFRFNFSVD